MKVIFLKDVAGQGKRVTLRMFPAFAENFLIKKGFAQIATSDIQAKPPKEGKEAEAKHQKELSQLQALKQDLEKRTLSLKVKVGDKGQVFGGVHEKDIASVISAKTTHPVEKNQVEIPSPIKQLGEHVVRVRLMGGIIATVKINVKQSDTIDR